MHTGIALHRGAEVLSAVEHSRVRIASLTEDEIAWYVATLEPMDKAGSYAIQGIGGIFVESVEGSYSNVVGLPLTTTYQLFRKLGCDLRTFRPSNPSRRRQQRGKVRHLRCSVVTCGRRGGAKNAGPASHCRDVGHRSRRYREAKGARRTFAI